MAQNNVERVNLVEEQLDFVRCFFDLIPITFQLIYICGHLSSQLNNINPTYDNREDFSHNSACFRRC